MSGAPNPVEYVLESLAKRRRRVVVIGDAMTDRWVHGIVHPDCQEGCPKFATESAAGTSGGSANAANCLARWDAKVSHYSYPLHMWPIKYRFVGTDGAVVFRADDETRERRVEPWMHALALEMVECADAVLLSDYDKGFLTPDFVRQVVKLCRGHGVPCVADCKRAPAVYEGCLLKGNAGWVEKYGCSAGPHVLVETRGADYPRQWWDGTLLNMPQRALSPVQCVNHVGAGDCFSVHLALALACGLSLESAVAVAHSAGRVYVQYEHNRPPDPREVLGDAAAGSVVAGSTPAGR